MVDIAPPVMALSRSMDEVYDVAGSAVMALSMKKVEKMDSDVEAE